MLFGTVFALYLPFDLAFYHILFDILYDTFNPSRTGVSNSKRRETRRCHKSNSFQRCVGVGNAQTEKTCWKNKHIVGTLRAENSPTSGMRQANDLMLYPQQLHDLKYMTELFQNLAQGAFS